MEINNVVTESLIDGITCLKVSIDSFKSNYSYIIEEGLEKYAKTENSKLILDLSDLTYINSLYLRVFQSFAKQAILHKSRFAFIVQDNVRKVFVITGFNSVIKIYNNPEAAISYIQGNTTGQP